MYSILHVQYNEKHDALPYQKLRNNSFFILFFLNNALLNELFWFLLWAWNDIFVYIYIEQNLEPFLIFDNLGNCRQKLMKF